MLVRLVVADSERVIYFEGDRQRYRIPGDRIQAIEETFLGDSLRTWGIETSRRRVAVLHVELLGGESLEIPWILRHSRLWPALRWGARGNFERLLRAIEAVLPETPEFADERG